MSKWGSGLLESNDELDTLQQMEAYTSNIDLYAPKDPDATCKALNDGKLKEILQGLSKEKPRDRYKYVLLGACVMRLGAYLPDRYRQYL